MKNPEKIVTAKMMITGSRNKKPAALNRNFISEKKIFPKKTIDNMIMKKVIILRLLC